MNKYQLGHHRVKVSYSLSDWDDALSCAFLSADPDYFDDAIAWSASCRNARSWHFIFSADLLPAAKAAIHHDETVGLLPDPDQRRCALLSPVTRPSMVNAKQRATRITKDFAALSDHYTWVKNIRVTQFAYLSNAEASEKIIEGFVDAIFRSGVGNSGGRWLVDVQRRTLPCFDRILRAAGADPVDNRTDSEASGDLMAAVRLGSPPQLEKQLNLQRSIDQVAGCDLNALMLAVSRGHTEIVAQLLDHGADTTCNNSLGKTAFLIAAQEGNLELLEPLLAAGSDLHACTLRGEDSLMFAANEGHNEVVQFLLEHGADPNRCNRFGQRASDFARSAGHRELAELLCA